MTADAGREARVLRLTRFRPREPWAGIDRALRATGIRSFGAQRGLVDAWFARRGPEFEHEHVIASVWESAAAERAGSVLPVDLPESDVILDEPARRVLRLVLDVRFPRAEPPAILRIYDGRTRPGQLDAYVGEAGRGVLLDGQAASGPAAVCMSVDPPDRFVTASLWTGWASIEACTGGDIRRPLATRNHARLAGGGPVHYEVILALDGLPEDAMGRPGT